MIPSPLSESDPREVIPEPTLELLHRIDRYVVAEGRTVRRYRSRAGLQGNIDELTFVESNGHTQPEQIEKK